MQLLRQVERVNLSVCLICKNEENNIRKCLESIQAIADEIIVVDTGSSDNTINIAKNFGARVIEYEWKNNFSAARNVSLDSANGQWILFLDCDEEVTKDNALKIKKLIKSSKKEGYYFKLMNMVGGEVIGTSIVLRLFRNRKEYRFKGRIHEQIVGEIQKRKGVNSIGSVEINLLHYGYDPKVADIKKKSMRNLEILNSFPPEERDGYFYYALGNEYVRDNNYDKALKNYYEGLKVSNYKEVKTIYYPYLAINIVKSLNALKKFQESLTYIKMFQKEIGDLRDLYFLETLIHMECSRYSMARIALDKYINSKNGKFEYPMNNFEQRYDIKNILCQLNEACIPHKEKLLSVVILLNKESSYIVEAIRSINDLALEIFILDCTSNEAILESSKQLGCKIISMGSVEALEDIKISMSTLEGEWILILNSDEICSYASQVKLAPILMNTEKRALKLSIFHVSSNNIEKEVRLLRNEHKGDITLKEIKFIYSDFVENMDILIHKLSS